MSDELNPAIIKRTQNLLGKYVKKPNLTEKLLKKPPFRFLHDVFRIIIRDTGYFVGLYSLEELSYENIKSRDDKMKFLQKMIDAVKLTTGASLPIKTSKIVAGSEPEKTNELLQLIGEIIENKLNWQTAVEEVLSGKTIHKDSPRKPRDKTNKVTQDTKSKENSKEKESKSKDSKVTKQPTANKITATTNKDDKTKISKINDKTTRKLETKEKSFKKTKGPEKSGKRQDNDPSKANQKLIKTESQLNNKSSPSLGSQEPKGELKSAKNETAYVEQKRENSQIVTPPTKLPYNSVNNEILNTNKVSIDIDSGEKDSSLINNLELEGLPVKNENKSSAKTRILSASKSAKVFGEDIDNEGFKNNSEMATSFTPAQEISNISEPGAMAPLKRDTFVSTTDNEQQQIKNYSESEHLNKKNTQEPLSTLPQKSPPVSLTNEIKRESTFTRENSKESNKSSNRPRTSLRPPSARPPSARPGAPRRRDKNIEIILQPNDEIKMSGIQVKLENFGDLDDDGENLVIIENPNVSDGATAEQSNLTESEKMMKQETLEQGHLVQQILETQKELVQQLNDASSQQKNIKESANNTVMRQTSARHMNNLRDVIQNLTKSINPLGKLMDFIPEDIDAMQLEFTLWRDAYTQAANELRREKSLTESATEPMKAQLVQIEANVDEYREMIIASRVKILQNSEKIINMLTTS